MVSVRCNSITVLPAKNRSASASVSSGVQGAAEGMPTNTETGRHRKSTHMLLALRRSTTTPTGICARAVDLNSLSPHVPHAALSRYYRASIINVRRSSRHDWKLLLVEGGHRLGIQLQMRLHQLGRCQRQPLIERDVGVIAALEYLEEAHRRGSDVLDIVPHRERHVADVAALKVEGTRLA